MPAPSSPIIVEGGSPPLSKNDFVVLVMGTSGAGKSSFINTLVPGSSAEIGDGLSSCTHNISVYPCDQLDMNGKRLVLVDTPGFGDNTMPDALFQDEVTLETIAGWLAAIYSQKIVPAGILLLQDIGQIPTSESSRKHCKMFQKLCGKGCFQNVLIVTTMWDTPVGRLHGDATENSLRDDPDFWKHMIARGSQVMRYHNNRSSAEQVIQRLGGREPIPLLIQHEMVKKGKDLAETAAGMFVYGTTEEDELRQGRRSGSTWWKALGERTLRIVFLGFFH